MPTTLAACAECGAEFHARANASYCSAPCRQSAHRRQRNAGADGARKVSRSATIGSLISALETITRALEKHTAAMNYPGTDEFNVHTFGRHPFDDNAYEVLHDLTQRIEEVSNDLCSVEEERQSYEVLTPQQQKSRTVEFEELAHDAQASAVRDAKWERGATARETAWAALPSEVTAPGRYHESVIRCAECGSPVETIGGIHRCWACFRRGQDGRSAGRGGTIVRRSPGARFNGAERWADR